MSHVFRLTDEEVTALREREGAASHCDVHFDVCPTCAEPRWAQSNSGGTGATTAAIADSLCEGCASFRYRHPEVYMFVVKLVTSRALIRERTTPKGGGDGST